MDGHNHPGDGNSFQAALNTPLPHNNDSVDGFSPLAPPNPRFSSFSPSTSSARESYADNNSALMLTEKHGGDLSPHESAVVLGGEKPAGAIGGGSSAPWYKRRTPLLLLAAAGIILIAAAVTVPVVLVTRNNNDGNGNLSSGHGGPQGGNGGGDSGPTDGPVSSSDITGGDGSIITMEDGTTFEYVNKLGGFWVSDPNDPYNNSAQAQSYSPALNQPWRWGVDKIYGVNIGGLFVLEPFISPAIFEKYPGAVDEWTVSELMAADEAGGGLAQLEDHYNTFITEKDIADIAGAGLNWVRLPVPYWAVEKYDNEPFLAQTCWKYVVRLLQWCRKYGLRVKLDLHTVPGSQNGYNHSGRSGQINFLHGVMGVANAERVLYHIRVFTEFISQDEWKDVVPMFGIMNEPRAADIGVAAMENFNFRAYEMIREITGIGEGNGPFISYHDGFRGTAAWAGFMTGADRIVMDVHPYFAFNGEPNTDPVGVWAARACERFGGFMNTSQSTFGISIAGEFSNGINDCGHYLNGVTGTPTYGGDCSFWEDSSQWNQTVKDGLKDFALASMDSLQNWFFWTWKIGNTTTTGVVGSPLWSYQEGLLNGWMPTDPREAVGTCERLGQLGEQFDGTFEPWQTGGAGAGEIDAAQLATLSVWPPAEIVGGGAGAELPTYTATGPVVTLPPTLTFFAAGESVTVEAGDGWFNDNDSGPGVTPVAGCDYPDAWDANDAAVPAACTGAAARRRYMPRTAGAGPVRTAAPRS